MHENEQVRSIQSFNSEISYIASLTLLRILVFSRKIDRHTYNEKLPLIFSSEKSFFSVSSNFRQDPSGQLKLSDDSRKDPRIFETTEEQINIF